MDSNNLVMVLYFFAFLVIFLSALRMVAVFGPRKDEKEDKTLIN